MSSDGDTTGRRDAVLADGAPTGATAAGSSGTDVDADTGSRAAGRRTAEPDAALPDIVSATEAPRLTDAAVSAPTVPTVPTIPSERPPAPAPVVATGWGDHMATGPRGASGAPLRTPGRRPRVRRVTRVLRHIDPWSTFKVALVFSAVAYLVALTSGVLLWRVADSTGTLANVERWFTQFGWETFELKGDEIFHNAWIIGLFGAVALTGGLVLLATLFNLVSDIVGGVRLTVLEEEVVERTLSSNRRYVVRRPPIGTDTVGDGAVDWDVDEHAESKRPVPDPVAPDESSPSSTAEWSIDDDDVDDMAREPGPARTPVADDVATGDSLPHASTDWSVDDAEDEAGDASHHGDRIASSAASEPVEERWWRR